MTIATGLLYVLGYFSDRLRWAIGEHVPMEPAPVGMFILFCIGATLGMYSACLLAPAAYLSTEEGRRLMRTMTGTESTSGFRTAAATAVGFLLFATAVTLNYVFVHLRD